MREYDIKMLIRKVMNDNGGNPYHDEKGRFTFSPSGVSANFEKSEGILIECDIESQK